MNPLPPSPESLERFVNRALREIPAPAAPASLAARVLAEIARLDRLPWWKKSFVHWPAGVRLAFFVTSAVSAGVVVAVGVALATRMSTVAVGDGVIERFGWLAAGRDILASGARLAEGYLQEVPALWWYGAIAGVTAAYGLVIGAGVATYRYFKFSR